VVGSYQGCSEALHGLAREAAKAKATAKWRQMGVRSVHEARSVRDLHARRAAPTAASVFLLAVVGACHPRPPVPVIGRPNPDILHHGPPPAYAHTAERLLAGPTERGVAAGACMHPGGPRPAGVVRSFVRSIR
jgi:hypothetical protein